MGEELNSFLKFGVWSKFMSSNWVCSETEASVNITDILVFVGKMCGVTLGYWLIHVALTVIIYYCC